MHLDCTLIAYPDCNPFQAVMFLNACRYQMSFEDVMRFEKAEADDRTKQVEFTESLATIARRHSSECSTAFCELCVLLLF